MNFSIILASRERSLLLVDLMKSIKDTTTDIDNVEVLVGIDDDDPESHDAARHITGWHSFAKFHSRPRSNMLNRDYLNWLSAHFSTGKYVIVTNDDTAFRTPNWDQIALAKLDDYLKDKPDRIAYGYMSDALINRQGMDYCCFPLLTREGINALGFTLPAECPGWNADIIIWRLYSAVGRICDLSEIMVEHIAYHSGKRARDHISYHVENISNQGHAPVPMEEYIARLSNGITRAKLL